MARTRAFAGKACHGTVSFSHCCHSHCCRTFFAPMSHRTVGIRTIDIRTLVSSHCWPFRTVGIRTVGFALVSFALLSFALLSYKHLSSRVLQSNLSLRPPDKSDHLKIPDTPFQSLQFSDSNVRSVFLKMRPPEKCELRTPYVGPKLRINLGKATKYVKLSEKTFSIVQRFPRRHFGQAIIAFASSTWHGRCQLRPHVHVGTTDRWWRWLVRGHVYDSILKIFEPSLANETTWEIGPLIPSPFGGRNSEVWLY